MKVGRSSNARLDAVNGMDDLRRDARSDPEAKKKLTMLVTDGMLSPYWESRDPSNVVQLRPKGPGSGSRIKVVEGQIAKATGPVERAQFERLRDALERAETKKPSKRKAAA